MVGRFRCQTGGMLVYEGSRRQRGGNLFSTIKRMIIPIGRKTAPMLEKAGKDLLKRSLKVGVGTVKDRLTNNSTTLSDSFKKRAASAVDSVAQDYFGIDAPDIPFTSQDGAGVRRKRRKATTKRAPSAKRRKRAAPAKTRKRAPPTKRQKRAPKRKPARKSINKSRKQTKKARRRITDHLD
jgi:hypothetical protein